MNTVLLVGIIKRFPCSSAGRVPFLMIIKSGGVVLAVVYVLSRTFGKMSGAVLGGFIGRAHESVTKY